jgi:hypothetical protein
VIRELLEATPPPPPDEADVDALLYTFDLMRDARQKILDTMTGPMVISDDDRALAEALVARDAAWTEVLARAKESVGRQRMGTKQLRRYAPTDARDL